MLLHLSSFVWNVAQTTFWSGLSNRIYIRLESVVKGIYTWSFHDRIAIGLVENASFCTHVLKFKMQSKTVNLITIQAKVTSRMYKDVASVSLLFVQSILWYFSKWNRVAEGKSQR